MKIDLKRQDSSLTAAIHGRIDTTTAPDAENAILGALDGVTDLTLDFADVSYISSAGLRVLLLAYKQMRKQGKMQLINVGEVVQDILEITGFEELLGMGD